MFTSVYNAFSFFLFDYALHINWKKLISWKNIPTFIFQFSSFSFSALIIDPSLMHAVMKRNKFSKKTQ